MDLSNTPQSRPADESRSRSLERLFRVWRMTGKRQVVVQRKTEQQPDPTAEFWRGTPDSFDFK